MRKTYFYHALMFLSIFFFALVSIHILEWKKDQNKSIQIEQVLQKEIAYAKKLNKEILYFNEGFLIKMSSATFVNL